MNTPDPLAPDDPLAPLLRAFAEAERGPTPAELAAAPVLDLWQAVLEPSGHVILAGAATGHPVLRRDYITTSPVLWLSPDLSWARTLSRFYRLLTPLGQTLSGLGSTDPGGSLQILEAFGLPGIPLDLALEQIAVLQDQIRAARS